MKHRPAPRRPPPRTTCPRRSSRLEAYRRLASVTTDGEVDDIATEWVDRYGPVPDAAQRLLDVARLRAECHRLGLHDISIGNQARLGPIELKLSQATRLRRLSREAKSGKEDLRQLVVPVPRAGAVPWASSPSSRPSSSSASCGN